MTSLVTDPLYVYLFAILTAPKRFSALWNTTESTRVCRRNFLKQEFVQITIYNSKVDWSLFVHEKRKRRAETSSWKVLSLMNGVKCMIL